MYFLFVQQPSTSKIYTLSLHDALPIYIEQKAVGGDFDRYAIGQLRLLPLHEDVKHGAHCVQPRRAGRSEEHTSELQSPCNLVCRLLLEKKHTLKNVQDD